MSQGSRERSGPNGPVILLYYIISGILHFQKSSAQSACVQNLAQNEDFMRCTQSFMGIMQEMQGAGAAGSMSDPEQMYSVFCS